MSPEFWRSFFGEQSIDLQTMGIKVFPFFPEEFCGHVLREGVCVPSSRKALFAKKGVWPPARHLPHRQPPTPRHLLRQRRIAGEEVPKALSGTHVKCHDICLVVFIFKICITTQYFIIHNVFIMNIA